MTPWRVLLIDDEPAIRAALSRAAPAHVEVVSCGEGAEAQALLDGDARFDAIVCDVRMPGMDGVAFARWLAAAHPPLFERLVFATSDPDSVEGFGRAVLVKPFTGRALWDVVAGLAAKSGGGSSV